MTLFRQFTLAALSMVLLLAQMPVFAVDYYQQQLQNEQLLNRELERQKQTRHKSYGTLVGDKALNGFANMTTAPLEIPKSIINYTNEPDSNIVYGVFGGIISGALNATGRVMTGFTDLITFPLPTKPIVQPRYVWDDFDKTNSYGQVFRLVDRPKSEPYVAPELRPVAVQNPPIADRTDQYTQETNKNLDTMFRKEMMK
jgi:putative exosortase-associated protein (TIGR04073 family)